MEYRLWMVPSSNKEQIQCYMSYICYKLTAYNGIVETRMIMMMTKMMIMMLMMIMMVMMMMIITVMMMMMMMS